LSLPGTVIQTAESNRMSLTALLLTFSGFLNACSYGSTSLSVESPGSNNAPEIMSISLGCDLATESVSIRKGNSAEFFLLVDDESPLDLSYLAEVQNPDIASVSVDSEGILHVSGLTIGRTDLSVKVTDSDGLEDNIVIRIIIDL